MADTSTSPLDLGKLVIDGNSAMLSNKSKSSNGVDPQAILTSLIAQQVAQQGNNISDSSPTGLNQMAIDSATKVVKKHYDDQASQMAATPDGISTLQQLIDTHNKSQNNNVSDSSSSIQQPLDNGQYNNQQKNDASMGILKQVQGATNPNPIMDLLGYMTGFGNNKLANLESAQKITGTQQLQGADIARMANETQQKINQALTVPPTQAEKMQNAAAYAGYKTSALKDMLDNTDKAMAQQNEVMKNMQGYSSWFNKPIGAMPKEAQGAMKKLQQLQLERIAVSSKLNEHQKLLATGGSSTSPFIEGQIYTDANGNKATFKNGKFQ